MSARNLTYPGVYVQELPSTVRTVTGVSTSVTAFVGRALKGPVDKPVLISSFADYERIFGGLWKKSAMSYSVYQYYQNGGRDALIIRVVHKNSDPTKSATESSMTIKERSIEEDESSIKYSFTIKATNPGKWSRNLKVEIEDTTLKEGEEIVIAETDIDPIGTNSLFTLHVKEQISENESNMLETFRNLSTKKDSPRFVSSVLLEESNFISISFSKVEDDENSERPPRPPSSGEYSFSDNVEDNSRTIGSDGEFLLDSDVTGKTEEGTEFTQKRGLELLDDVDIFNLLCIPPYKPSEDTSVAVYKTALKYCEDRRAMLLVDSPKNWNNVNDAKDSIDSLNLRNKNAVIYFPHILASDPKEEGRLREFVPCGTIAGIIARTDDERGVWKSPAGIESTLNGVSDLAVHLTDDENGRLNPLGINCIRIKSPAGIVVWGARTMRGADSLADQWKYLAVRRTALFIEESLYRGTEWVVFEPNDEPLWAQIRLNIGAFMHDLYRQGAFQGSTPDQAYLVKCDEETTTQNDIDRGIVNIVVGFAPLKPAEFVILKIQQLVGRERI